MKHLIVAGLDVGDPKKGFHAVALRDGRYLERFTARDASEIAAWCRNLGVTLIGVDAPCRWSMDGHARKAELDLRKEGIQAFAAPARERASGHPFYAWMMAGERLYEALYQDGYPLLDDMRGSDVGPLCFETFPHAVACALAGRVLAAKDKNPDRRALLEKSGISSALLPNMDFVDAALCALTAHHLANSAVKSYGDAVGGYILVPGYSQPSNTGVVVSEQGCAPHFEIHAIRHGAGADLRSALAALPREQGFEAGFILTAVGSLSRVRLRFAGAETVWEREADFEILTLSGTLGPDGPHLHMSVADAAGAVTGGHVLEGCEVRTTAEIVVGIAPGWTFRRALDPATGYLELRAEAHSDEKHG